MAFKKPFRAEPVVLGEYARAQDARARRSNALRMAGVILLLTFAIFVAGMAITNWSTFQSAAPVYYRSCVAAGRAGAAPINQGAPGYRAELDEDGDGIACEGFGD